MKMSKFLVSILVFLISLPIFIYLESGFAINSFFDILKPLIFSASLIISINTIFRRFLLMISLIFLSFMVVFYIFWKMDFSNWLGSVGFGMLIIYVLGYLPEIIKKGFVEKL